MKRARFVAEARREFLVEVVYYNKEEPGLARVSLRPSKMQRLVPWPSRLPVRPRPKILGEFFSRTFLSLLSIGPMPMGSPSLHSRITRDGRATGNRVFRTANKSLQPSGYARRHHLDALARAAQSLQQGQTQLNEHGAGELLANDLHAAQQALAEITGEFTADDLLGRIFSAFCIVK